MQASDARELLFVTGGSSGIGRALIEGCPHAETRVVNLSRRAVDGVVNIAVDLCEPAGWDAAARAFESELSNFGGRRAILVHSAGTLTPIGFAGEKGAASYRRNILLNSAAPQIVGDAFLRALGSHSCEALLVFIGSGASQSAYAGWSGYCGGKAAVDQWTRTVGLERTLRTTSRKVLCVAPGIVQTAMQAEIRDTSANDFPEVKMFIELHEGGSLRTSEEVARDLWQLIDDPATENGSVLDLRTR